MKIKELFENRLPPLTITKYKDIDKDISVTKKGIASYEVSYKFRTAISKSHNVHTILADISMDARGTGWNVDFMFYDGNIRNMKKYSKYRTYFKELDDAINYSKDAIKVIYEENYNK